MTQIITARTIHRWIEELSVAIEYLNTPNKTMNGIIKTQLSRLQSGMLLAALDDVEIETLPVEYDHRHAALLSITPS